MAVVTTPDRPGGRGYHLIPTDVKQWALCRNVPLLQPEKFDHTFLSILKELEPDFVILAAYGKILPRQVLQVAKIAALNVHPSLLPLYRGPAPMEWALLDGQKKTGVTIIVMDEQLDSGDIIAQQKLTIEPEDDIFSLKARLMEIAGSLLPEAMEKILSGEKPRPQTGTPTYARRLVKKDGLINWSNPATRIHNQIRALAEWPVAFTYLPLAGRSRYLKIRKSQIVNYEDKQGQPGQILKTDGQLLVACGKGTLSLVQLQLEGRKNLPVKEFLRGTPVACGQFLGQFGKDEKIK